MIRPPPKSPLFPYTTLFRSVPVVALAPADLERAGHRLVVVAAAGHVVVRAGRAGGLGELQQVDHDLQAVGAGGVAAGPYNYEIRKGHAWNPRTYPTPMTSLP